MEQLEEHCAAGYLLSYGMLPATTLLSLELLEPSLAADSPPLSCQQEESIISQMAVLTGEVNSTFMLPWEDSSQRSELTASEDAACASTASGPAIANAGDLVLPDLFGQPLAEPQLKLSQAIPPSSTVTHSFGEWQSEDSAGSFPVGSHQPLGFFQQEPILIPAMGSDNPSLDPSPAGGDAGEGGGFGPLSPGDDAEVIVYAQKDASERFLEAGEFLVARRGDLETELTVQFSLSGIAVNAQDYVSVTGSVTIPAFEAAAVVTITPLADTAVEGDETVILTVTPSAAYIVGDPGTATILIEDAEPAAIDDAYSVLHNQLLQEPASGVLLNDFEPDELPLTASLVSGPTNGTLSLLTDGSFTYTPTAGYVGTDSFTYTASNGQQTTNVATVTIDVTNTPPVANADSYGVHVGLPLTVSAARGVLANDTDADGDPLTATVLAGPTNGALQWNTTGAFTYTPNVGYIGNDTFTYQMSDGAANAQAIVTLNVHGANAAPTGNPDRYGVEPDDVLDVPTWGGVAANDYDPDGDPITVQLVTGPSNGTLTLNPDGSFQYTPNAGFAGQDSFTYQGSDGFLSFAPTIVLLDVFSVIEIKYLPTGPIGSVGDISEDNPDGMNETPAFGGGWRFFPDASDYANRTTARNIIRIQITAAPYIPYSVVYFRSFDVDDPSTNRTIDRTGERGRDNRGTLENNNPGKPGPIAEKGGYSGRLAREIENPVPEGQIVSVPVNILEADSGTAVVRLFTGFNPGDNYRVVASANIFRVAALNAATGVPTQGAVPNFRGLATDQVSVWRRLHIEQDRMDAMFTARAWNGQITHVGNPDADGRTWLQTNFSFGTNHLFDGGSLWDSTGKRFLILGNSLGNGNADVIAYVPQGTAAPALGGVELIQGDTQWGQITATSAPTNGLVVVTTNIRIAEVNEYQGGTLRTGGSNYHILANTNGANAKLTILANAAPANGDVQLFQDELSSTGDMRGNTKRAKITDIVRRCA